MTEIEIEPFKDKQCRSEFTHTAHDWHDVIDPYCVMYVHCAGVALPPYLLTKTVACEAVIATLFELAQDAYVYRSLAHWERTLRRYMWASYDDAVLWRAIVRWTRSDVELGTHHTAVMALSSAERWAKLVDFPRRHR